MSAAVTWHDLECGGYTEDLSLWLELANRHGSPILDVGAGTGRVSLMLAGAGHRVVALDNDPALLEELQRRVPESVEVDTVTADARDFNLPDRRFGLVIAPMQTIQLLGGAAGRVRFLTCAAAHLAADGAVAVAIAGTENIEEFEWHDGDAIPLPDIVELDGSLYSSQPTAVRRDGDGFVLERRREMVDAAGVRSVEPDAIRLDALTVTGVELAGQQAGLQTLAVRRVYPTLEHVGSEVVVLGE